jgi:hypothetical protein
MTGKAPGSSAFGNSLRAGMRQQHVEQLSRHAQLTAAHERPAERNAQSHDLRMRGLLSAALREGSG